MVTDLVAAARPLLAYCASLPQESPSSFLSAGEQAALDRLTFDKRRMDWSRGRFAVKSAASRWLALRGAPLSLSAIEIVNDDAGRPFVRLSDPCIPKPFISLSHCAAGGFAAAHGAPIGVDWEPVAAREPGLLAHFAREDEDAGTPESQTALWTVKEAVLKMLGLGLSGGLKNVRWDGKTTTLYGTALDAWEEQGGRGFAVDQWIDGEVSLAVSYMEETP